MKLSKDVYYLLVLVLFLFNSVSFQFLLSQLLGWNKIYILLTVLNCIVMLFFTKYVLKHIKPKKPHL